MTQRKFFTAVIEANVSDELTAFAETAITKLDERNAKKSSTLTAKQKDNIELMAQIFKYVSQFDGGRTASEVADAFSEREISTSKASALLRKMWDNGEMSREEIKIKGKGKVMCYKVIEKTETTEENVEE